MTDSSTTNPRIWVRDITQEAIKHFAWGIGDNNPLWLPTNNSAAFAPPCILYAVHETTVAPGMKDHRRIYRSADWTWFQKIPLNTEISTAIELLQTKTKGNLISQIGRVEYSMNTKEKLAEAIVQCERTSDETLLEDDYDPYKYSSTELQEIEESILSESRKSDIPKLWEKTKVGESLGTLTKGPLSIMDIVAWSAGTTGVPATNDEVSEGGLLVESTTGPQITSWLAQLATDWIGEEGFLHRLNVHLIKLPKLGSTTIISGELSTKYRVESYHLAEVKLTARDFSGREIANGLALIFLPTNNAPIRLPLEEKFSFNSAGKS